MHALDIQDALVKFLENALKDYLLQTKDENVSKPPSIYDGYLPPKKNIKRGEVDTEQDDYPFVIVRYLDDADKIFNSNTIHFKLIVGTYNKDEQHGWRDTLGLMIRIKTKLKEQQVIGAGNLTGTISTKLFEEQIRPMWHGVMEVEFEMPQIQRNWSGVEDEY